MSKVKIFIVEDENIVAMHIKHKVESLGYQVTAITPSGEEALEILSESSPDLVLMDIVLKGQMDGIETAKKIREAYEIPVVYLTAYSDENTLRRAKVAEPFGYLIKPFEDRELHSAIEIALYKHDMESKLKESEKWLSITLESIGDAVIATDPNGKIKLINPVASKITGWKHNTAIGRPLNEVFQFKSNKSDTKSEDYVLKIFENNKILELPNQMHLINKMGNEIAIEASSTPIKDENDKIMGTVLIFRDITERQKALKEREELLKDKARGELSNFMISALPVFASNIPPQVRTYISRSFADRFEKLMKPQFQEELKTCMKTKNKENPEDVLSCYLTWISDFMSNLDINTEISSHNGNNYLKFNNCPWNDEENITPVFCLICRAIVIRSFTWTSLRGHVEQSHCLLEGSDKCSFQFIINIENPWNNELE